MKFRKNKIKPIGYGIDYGYSYPTTVPEAALFRHELIALLPQPLFNNVILPLVHLQYEVTISGPFMREFLFAAFQHVHAPSLQEAGYVACRFEDLDPNNENSNFHLVQHIIDTNKFNLSNYQIYTNAPTAIVQHYNQKYNYPIKSCFSLKSISKEIVGHAFFVNDAFSYSFTSGDFVDYGNIYETARQGYIALSPRAFRIARKDSTTYLEAILLSMAQNRPLLPAQIGILITSLKKKEKIYRTLPSVKRILLSSLATFASGCNWIFRYKLTFTNLFPFLYIDMTGNPNNITTPEALKRVILCPSHDLATRFALLFYSPAEDYLPILRCLGYDEALLTQIKLIWDYKDTITSEQFEPLSPELKKRILDCHIAEARSLGREYLVTMYEAIKEKWGL